jgi:signal transduction histidine kinase
MTTDSELYLRRACRLTGASWAAVVISRRGQPAVRVETGLAGAKMGRLEAYLGKLQERVGNARVTARNAESTIRVPTSTGLGVARLVLLPFGRSAVLAVGLSQARRSSKQTWRMIAGMMNHGHARAGRSLPVPAFKGDLEDDTNHALDRNLAGIVENSRRRAEGEGDGRQLTLVRDVVEQLIGHTDERRISEIAALRLAQFLKGHRTAVVLRPGESAAMSFGFGGSWTQPEKQAFVESYQPLRGDMLGRPLRAGEQTLPDKAGIDVSSTPIPGEFVGAICIPIRFTAGTLGAIFVSSARENELSDSEVLAVESLAAALSAVVSSVAHQRRLAEMINELRAAQLESGARLAAQQQAESRLVHAAKLVAVGEMAAGVAHELNNPLTTIAGFAELILDDTPTDATYRADVEMVLREARRARSVVRRLLDFSRQGEHVRARVDINEVIQDALALMTHFIHTSGVQLDLDLAGCLPWILVDSNQMKQVLLNLVHNALNAMPGGGRLHIRTSIRSKDERSWIVIQVADNGVGIDEKDLDRIFEPFYTTRADSGGTGLGLSVTYGLVMDHGGTIDVESQRGSGSVFSVWLPA